LASPGLLTFPEVHGRAITGPGAALESHRPSAVNTPARRAEWPALKIDFIFSAEASSPDNRRANPAEYLGILTP
jgi:hypothetical protein